MTGRRTVWKEKCFCAWRKNKNKKRSVAPLFVFGGTSVLYGGHDFDLGMIIDGQRFFIPQR